jgi:hypothetical protein
VRGDSSRPWWREWTQPSGYVAITGALGLLAFLILNVACAVFYDPLGVDPREVGLGYGEMLVKAATGAAMLFVAVTVLLGVVLLTAVAVLDLIERVTTLDRLLRSWACQCHGTPRSLRRRGKTMPTVAPRCQGTVCTSERRTAGLSSSWPRRVIGGQCVCRLLTL